MTDYLFAYHNGEPESVYRILENPKRGEYYNFKQKLWLPNERISWCTWSGEIGYEPTTEELAMKFIESKLAEEA